MLRNASNSFTVLALLPLLSDWALSNRAFNRSWTLVSDDELLLLELELELELELLLSDGGGGGGP